MEIRTTAPAVNNKRYINTSKGGLNKCIIIDKTNGSVLPNCTGYAYGRFLESANLEHCTLPTTNACNWFSSSHGYETGSIAKQGAIICYSGGWENRGHVAYVEQVYDNKSILISQSNYGGKRFETQILQFPYYKSGLNLQGFIYNPYIDDVPSKIKMYGCDVSKWQVPNRELIEEMDFVIIQATYAQQVEPYGNEWRLLCEEMGIPYGVYCYSYAESVEEARKEAEFLAQTIDGWNVQIGTWFDIEMDDFHVKHGITSSKQWTDFSNTFCQKMQELGYYTGIYSSESNFTNLIKTTEWDRWVASWGTNNGYIQRDTSHLGTMLQYTSHGGLDKDVSYVDLAHYKSFPAVSEPIQEPNEEKPTESEKPSENGSNVVIIDWKRKLSSRKFWSLLAGIIISLCHAFDIFPDETNVTSIVMAVGICVAYILGESWVDSSFAKESES